jgi:hypothetical protein
MAAFQWYSWPGNIRGAELSGTLGYPLRDGVPQTHFTKKKTLTDDPQSASCPNFPIIDDLEISDRL